METTTHTLWDVLMQLTAADLPMVITLTVFFSVIMVVVVTATIARTVHHMHRNRLDDSLKRELVERGLSAAEIEQILEATSGTARGQGEKSSSPSA